MTDPLIGTTVGHYEVVAKLGGGGMGVVYKARDNRLERQVALKFLPAQWSNDEDAKRRFMREAQAASATDHPSICTIHGIDQAPDGQLFIVMAYYEGVTLKQRLEGGRLPVEEALEIATQVAQGLARAHRAGVVHRDIKPSNLILTDDALKIVDFGLAKFADSLHLTVSAAPLGTYAYMSPEQVRAEEATAQTDVWATGVVLYEMLVGHPPFQGSYFEAIAHAIRHESPAPIRASRPEVSEAVERVVFRAMHKDLAVRYANGKELALALLQARGLSAPVDLRSGVVEVPPAPGGRRRAGGSIPALAHGGRRGRAGAGAPRGSLCGDRTGRPGPREAISVVPGGQPDRLSGARAVPSGADLRPDPGAGRVGARAPARLRPRGPVRRARRWPAAPTCRTTTCSARWRPRARARWTIVPTLLHENGAWRARAVVQDAATGSTVTQLETEAVASSLTKDAAYSRIVALADLIESHFVAAGGGAAALEPPPQRAAAHAGRRAGARVGTDGDGAAGVLGGARGVCARRRARRPASAAAGVAQPRRAGCSGAPTPRTRPPIGRHGW